MAKIAKALKKDLESVNNKIQGKRYKYIHSMDCYIYVTLCENCKKEVGDWTEEGANKKWEDHKC